MIFYNCLRQALHTLKVLPLPVGNWKDLTATALQTLACSDIILCEDTRVAGNMFKTIRSQSIKEQLQRFTGSSIQELPEYVEQTQNNQAIKRFNSLDKSAQREYLSTLNKQEYLRFKFNLLQHKKEQLLLDIEDFPHTPTAQKILNTRLTKGRGLLVPLTPRNMPSVKQQLPALLKDYKITLVCDRGVPGISDPGQQIVQSLNSKVDFIQGGCGVLSLTTDLQGTFVGFSDRPLKQLDETTTFFCNQQRLQDRLRMLHPQSVCYLTSELTKINETKLYGTAKSLLQKITTEKSKGRNPIRGQITVTVVFPKRGQDRNQKDKSLMKVNLDKVSQVLMNNLDHSEQQLAVIMQEVLGVGKTQGYKSLRRVREKLRSSRTARAK